MITSDYVFIGILIIAALAGYMLGFGRSLKRATKGIFGVAIAVTVCFMFGGILRNISAVDELVTEVNTRAIEFWSFLKYLHIGEVVYYVVLFMLVQVLRIIVIKVICGIFEADNSVIKVINKLLGTVFMAAFCFGLILLFLALVKSFDNTQLAKDLLKNLDGGILMNLYKNNPIKF